MPSRLLRPSPRILKLSLLSLSSLVFSCSILTQTSLPSADRAVLWIEPVRRGDVARSAHGVGIVNADRFGKPIAYLNVLGEFASDVTQNQKTTVEINNASLPGHVIRVAAPMEHGTRVVEISLDGPLPKDIPLGSRADADIELETLRNVLYMTRPVHGDSNTTISMFKLTKNDTEAVRIPVKLGRASVNQIEVLSGLAVGDKVILSDMAAYNTDRIALQ